MGESHFGCSNVSRVDQRKLVAETLGACMIMGVEPPRACGWVVFPKPAEAARIALPDGSGADSSRRASHANGRTCSLVGAALRMNGLMPGQVGTLELLPVCGDAFRDARLVSVPLWRRFPRHKLLRW